MTLSCQAGQQFRSLSLVDDREQEASIARLTLAQLPEDTCNKQ